MTSDDLFTVADKKPVPEKEQAPKLSNVPEMSVADLANSLKRTLEQTYGHIRVRGELSGLKLAASGHLYGDIKDVDANINIVCWRGVMNKLSICPEEGMDVIITGRVSSYAKSSRYQIIVESIELAGEGALLKMLEERRKKLAAEGLFDESRKKPLPYLPNVIGVVTSPTGAVIQDIMHRLKDRFPRHVLVWPVNVQGKGADEQITQAINGFNAINGKNMPKPDLLIVARGGGSLEDLMAFNEENVVRAVANSKIPVISAVGHETDTTLIDYAADKRAPTPTGAAEMAVPVRLDIHAYVQNMNERMKKASERILKDRKNMLSAQTARLAHPRQILENKSQTIDLLGEKLSGHLKSLIQNKKSQVQNIASNLISPKYAIEQKSQALEHVAKRLPLTMPRIMSDKQTRLENILRMLNTLSHQSVLERGYAIIRDTQGKVVRSSENIAENQDLGIEWANNDKIHVKTVKK